MKPVRADRLAEAVRRVVAAADPGGRRRTARQPSPRTRRSRSSSAGVTRFITSSQIRYAQAQGDYARLHTGTGSTSSASRSAPSRSVGRQRVSSGSTAARWSPSPTSRRSGWSTAAAASSSEDAELQVSRRHTRELRDRLLAPPRAQPVTAPRPVARPTGHRRARGGPPPVRVRVTSTRATRPTRRDLRPLTHDIDEQTTLGEVYMAGLMSAQLRLALRGAGLRRRQPRRRCRCCSCSCPRRGPWRSVRFRCRGWSWPSSSTPWRSSSRATTSGQSERIEAEFSDVVRRR